MTNPNASDQETPQQSAHRLGHGLRSDVLQPLKQSFVGKDEIIDLMGLCLVARENLFLLGPPGTAKSALVQSLARQIDGRLFDYLLTKFTEPNEIFGPFDIRKLRDGELETNTSGMLPEADFIFLDELLNANSAILNSLLLVLNERVFRRGRETKALPTLMVVGASNHLPEDETLNALFDRFLVRVNCINVPDENLSEVLYAGWKLDAKTSIDTPNDQSRIGAADLRQMHRLVSQVDLQTVQLHYVDLVIQLRGAGIQVSDRRAVKLQRLIAASALLCGRLQANRTDLWVLRYIWDTEDEQEILASLVGQFLNDVDDDDRVTGHPQSQVSDVPDPEKLHMELTRIQESLDQEDALENSVMRDRLVLLTARCQWVADVQKRSFLENEVNQLWQRLNHPNT